MANPKDDDVNNWTSDDMGPETERVFAPAGAQQEQPPQDWPTQAMIRAAMDCQDAEPGDSDETIFYYAFRAALAAAPKHAQQGQPAVRLDALEASDDHDHQTAPAWVEAQYAVYDEDKKKVIQCHPHTDAGKRKVEWQCRCLMEGTPFKLKWVTLYMKAEDQ